MGNGGQQPLLHAVFRGPSESRASRRHRTSKHNRIRPNSSYKGNPGRPPNGIPIPSTAA